MLENNKKLVCGKFSLSLDRPLVMGILNVTPDSFSDGGRYEYVDAARARAIQMVEQGADIIDIGGESTRPGSTAVSTDEELARVVPLIEALSSELEVPISIDTSKATVMYEAVQAGASMLNDVCALQSEGALQVAAKLNVPVCLMHMQGEPRSMQTSPEYNDVVGDVFSFLKQRAEICLQAGIAKEQIIIDPGFGFGKTLEHNLSLLANLSVFVASGYPVLVGLSRKSMLAKITNKAVTDRLAGSIALATLAARL